MERHLTQGITEYWLRLPLKYKAKLSRIRVWQELKMAIDEDDIWVRGIHSNKLHSPEIRSIPFKKIYFQKENALFLLGGNLPEIRLKTSLLWSPIHNALPVEMPSYNFNYFGISEKIKVSIKPSTEEKESKALLVSKSTFEVYIHKAPAIRLKNLSWTIINEDVFVIGFPLLPIPGKSFWQKGEFLIPTGYNFENPELSGYINKKINTNNESYIVFNKDSSYYKIPKEKIRSLTISSYRLSQ